jgi:hypothetical protein
MNPAEKETVETFCRELALALRRITGKKIDIDPATLINQSSQAEPPSPENLDERSDA